MENTRTPVFEYFSYLDFFERLSLSDIGVQITFCGLIKCDKPLKIG